MNILQSLILGIIQGITEILPISSLGHSTIIPKILNWSISPQDSFFLTFLAVTHTTTAIILILYFKTEWKRILIGFLSLLKNRQIDKNNQDAKMAWFILICTVPTFILGVLSIKVDQLFFASPILVAVLFMVNGAILMFAEIIQKKKKREIFNKEKSFERITKLTSFQAATIGLFQSLGLIPGISRTGSALAGGLLFGLSHEDSVRFSLILATPILGIASLFRLPEVIIHQETTFILPSIVGAVSTSIFAYLSIKFVTKYFETKSLWPFAIYCLGIGCIVSIYLLAR